MRQLRASDNTHIFFCLKPIFKNQTEYRDYYSPPHVRLLYLRNKKCNTVHTSKGVLSVAALEDASDTFGHKIFHNH